MPPEALQSRFAIVALFETFQNGTTLSRRAWPAHVTLASNFTADMSVDDLSALIRGAGSLDDPLSVRFAGLAQFGPSLDIPVRLVESERIMALHRHLADRLENQPGFSAEEPGYWRSGYRPHVTLSPGITAPEGASRSLCCIAIAHLRDDEATLAAGLDLKSS